MATQGFLQPEHGAEGAREAANAWVARFAPLVMEDAALAPADVRNRIDLVSELREHGPAVRDKLIFYKGADDDVLLSTLDSALEQLPSIEDDLRKRLGRLAPGDPEGQADLAALNERLAERQARQEIGLPTDLEVPARLTMRTAPPNWAAAGFIGLFGFGWTSFTIFHAVMMIGGMIKAFGYIALAMLGFYAIFFFVGFGMLAAAIMAASDESIDLDGRTLTVRRKLGGWVREKRYTLAPDAKAVVGQSSAMAWKSNRDARPVYAVMLTDVDGKTINLATSANDAQREVARDKINAYLQAQA